MLSWWEESPDGKRLPLSQTLQRLSYAVDRSKRILWTKDKVFHITLNNAYWMAKQLKKGNKLVMTFSQLGDKLWEKNYGSGKEVSTETLKDGRLIKIKIYTGTKNPSSIKVPVM